MNINQSHKILLFVLLLAVAGIAVYSHTLHVPFYLDDTVNIVENRHIRLDELTWHGLGDAAFKSLARTRPVANLSFAFNYYVHQDTTAGYHVVNIAIHILTGMALFLLFLTTFSTPALQSRYANPTMIAFFGALVWLVHPLHTQSVTYIVQRMNSMAALWYALALLLYARGRLASSSRYRTALYAGVAVAAVLSVGSKQIGATLPFFILFYEWCFFQNCSRQWIAGHKRLLVGAAALIICIGVLFLVFAAQGALFSLYDIRDFSMGERVLTQGRVVIFYLSLLLFPHPSRLNLDHDVSVSHSLFDPVTTVISFLAIALMLGAAGKLLKKEPLIAFSIIWFFGNLAIESSILPLELVFEHRTYLPSMFLAVSVSALLLDLTSYRWYALGALCGLSLLLAIWTYQRNTTWVDPVVFWQDCVRKSPAKARPHNNLGLALRDRGNMNEAARHFSTALSLDPDNVQVHNNIGVLYANRGNLERACYHFKEAIRIDPNHAEGYNNLGKALADQGNVDSAVANLKHALRIDPWLANAHDNLGKLYGGKGNLKKSEYHFRQVIRCDPRNATGHYHLGLVLARQGNVDEALRHFEAALLIDPAHEKARKHLKGIGNSR